MPSGETMSTESAESKRCHVLSLDGGGAKGFYTLGVLAELEAMLGGRLHEHFDLIYGTSTGAIIAALLGLGHSVEEVHALYRAHVVKVMAAKKPADKTAALAKLAQEVFGGAVFADMKTGVGLVATKWAIEKPMIFKSRAEQVHGRLATFTPGFGCTVADAVQASCSAFPFFARKSATTAQGDTVELADGGFCANNPTLYAIADATAGMQAPREALRVVSIGVGVYPPPKVKIFSTKWFGARLVGVDLIEKILETNTQSMEELRTVLFKDVATIRISETFSAPEMATDLFEHDLTKLNLLRQRGRESFASHEADLRRHLV